MKNRLLIDKLNAQLYKQASQYKEKTINALFQKNMTAYTQATN